MKNKKKVTMEDIKTGLRAAKYDGLKLYLKFLAGPRKTPHYGYGVQTVDDMVTIVTDDYAHLVPIKRVVEIVGTVCDERDRVFIGGEAYVITRHAKERIAERFKKSFEEIRSFLQRMVNNCFPINHTPGILDRSQYSFAYLSRNQQVKVIVDTRAKVVLTAYENDYHPKNRRR